MICPHCKKETRLKIYAPAEYARRKSENARNSMLKAKARGTILGRPRAYNYDKIRKLRASGLSFSGVAAEIGCPISSVQRALKERK